MSAEIVELSDVFVSPERAVEAVGELVGILDTVDESTSDVGRLEVTDELRLVATSEANDGMDEVDVPLAADVDDESQDEVSEETKDGKLEKLDELGRPEAVGDNKLVEVEVPDDAIDEGMVGLGMLGEVEDDNLDEADELVDISSKDEEKLDILRIDEESVGSEMLDKDETRSGYAASLSAANV